MSWFKDEEVVIPCLTELFRFDLLILQEKDKKFMLPLDQLKLRDIESTFMSRRFMFALYSSEGRNVFKDFKVNCLKRKICNLSYCCRLWICHVRHRMMWTPGKLLS